MAAAGFSADGIDTSKPQSARMYDYFLDGKDNYAVDWEAAEKVIALFPAVKQMARVVYADNDPIVLRHAEALLHGTPEGSTTYIQADVREPAKILAAAREVLDFEQPVALSLLALLHLVADEDDPHRIVAELLAALAPGSYLALSHATGDFDPETWERVVEVYRKGGTPAQVRSRAEFTAFFTGLELVDPGIELAARRHPELGERRSESEQIPLYVGVARTV